MIKYKTEVLLVALFCVLGVDASLFPRMAHSQSAAHEDFVERANANTVTVISGNPNGTYLSIAYDLSAVLDDGDNFRVLPVIGKGGAQNIRDVLYLKGVDMGIAQSNALRYFQETGEAGKNIEQRLRYIAKLYNEELHILASAEIKTVDDLNGKTVNFSDVGSGTQLSSRFLFRDLGINVKEVNFGQGDAIEKIKAGEIAATVLVAGKPAGAFRSASNDGHGLHFVAMRYAPSLPSEYLPSQLTHSDYPKWISEGETVDTLAIGAVLFAYNWPEGSERYRRVAAFVDTFFKNREKFLVKPRHPKWHELILATEVPGWTRFTAAQKALERIEGEREEKLKVEFQNFLQQQSSRTGAPMPPPAEQDALFRKFKTWQQAH